MILLLVYVSVKRAEAGKCFDLSGINTSDALSSSQIKRYLKYCFEDDNSAAVPGTGWTDISQLESNCQVPGYFVNPSDCSRFYVCVDHSTSEKHLLLRYDFECPAGLAFDEAGSICNYPGPTGCISNGGGWGWGKDPGFWQNSITIQKHPVNSWGVAVAGKVPVGGTPIVATGPPPVVHGGWGVKVTPTPTPAAPPVPANPQVNLPVLHGPTPTPTVGWESHRIYPVTNTVFQSVKVPHGHRGGWSPSKVVVGDTGVFQGVKVTHSGNGVVAWGTSKVIPVESTAFIQTPRVTPVPQAEWVTPTPLPAVSHAEVHIRGGWNGVKVAPTPVPLVQEGWAVTPTPTPVPANPVVHYEGVRVTPSPVPVPANPVVHFQGVQVTPSPVPFPVNSVVHGGWQPSKVTPVPYVPANPVVHGGWGPVKVRPAPISVNHVVQGGWEGVKVTPVPFLANQMVHGGGWADAKVRPYPLPANPVVHGGWGGAKVTTVPIPANPVVYQGWGGVKVTPTPVPQPVQGGVVFETGTKVPILTPNQFAWQSNRIPSPVPSPGVPVQGGVISQPVIPHGPGVIPQSPPVVWKGHAPHAKVAPAPQNPQVAWQGPSTPLHQGPPQSIPESSGRAMWQNENRSVQSQGPEQVSWNAPFANNAGVGALQGGPSTPPQGPPIQIPVPPEGWNDVRLTHIPSGYAWQTKTPVITKTSQEVAPSNGIAEGPPAGGPPGNTLQNGGANFGLVQQVINEDQSDQASGEKSHIQLIYETKEKEDNLAQNAAANEVQQDGGSNDASKPIYEIITAPDAGIPRGRFIVLYAPLTNAKTGKREVPVVEVQVEDDDTDITSKSEETSENQ